MSTVVLKRPAGKSGMNVTFRGFKQYLKLLKKTPLVLHEELETEMLKAAIDTKIGAEAMVPEKKKTLLRSIRRFSKSSKRRIRHVIFAGGDDISKEYAVRMHEDFYQLGFASSLKRTTQDGTPGRKYLERPFNRVVDRLLRTEIKDVVRKTFKRVSFVGRPK